MNRVLRENRYVMVTLPNQVTRQQDFQYVKEALGQYGFSVLMSDFFSGKVKTKSGSRNELRGFYFLLGKKRVSIDHYTSRGFDAFGDVKYRIPRTYRTVELPSDSLFDVKQERRKQKRKIYSDFFVDSRGNTLDVLLERLEV